MNSSIFNNELITKSSFYPTLDNKSAGIKAFNSDGDTFSTGIEAFYSDGDAFSTGIEAFCSDGDAFSTGIEVFYLKTLGIYTLLFKI